LLTLLLKVHTSRTFAFLEFPSNEIYKKHMLSPPNEPWKPQLKNKVLEQKQISRVAFLIIKKHLQFYEVFAFYDNN